MVLAVRCFNWGPTMGLDVGYSRRAQLLPGWVLASQIERSIVEL